MDLKAPDHTTISRRGQQLDVNLRHAAKDGPFHLFVDSTGLSIVGQGRLAAVEHGGSGKRAWKKLHLAVDRSGMIVAEVLTDGRADFRVAVGFMRQRPGKAESPVPLPEPYSAVRTGLGDRRERS
jgi:hypothetical protein